MFKRKLSLFLVVALLVGMMAFTAHAASFSLSFDFVNDWDTTTNAFKSGPTSSNPEINVDTFTTGLNSVYVEVYAAGGKSASTALTVRKTGSYTFPDPTNGYVSYYLKGTATGGYGYMTGTWTP